MSTIVDRLGLSRSTASRNVYSLCSGKVRRTQPKRGYGLVYTRPSDTDRRAFNVHLTRKGRLLRDVLLVGWGFSRVGPERARVDAETNFASKPCSTSRGAEGEPTASLH